MDIDEITGQWPYENLPANICVGRDCYFERRDSFGRFRSERSPGLILGNRVRVYTWTTFSIEDDGFVEVGDGTLLVGAHIMCADRITIGREVVVSYNVTITDCDFHPMAPDLRRADAVAVSPTGDYGRRPRVETAPVTIGAGFASR